MPMIVKTPNGDVMLFQQFNLVTVGIVVFKPVRLILVIIERRFVCDDEVSTRLGSSFNHVKGRKHCSHDPRYLLIGATGPDLINGSGKRSTRDFFHNKINYLLNSIGLQRAYCTVCFRKG